MESAAAYLVSLLHSHGLHYAASWIQRRMATHGLSSTAGARVSPAAADSVLDLMLARVMAGKPVYIAWLLNTVSWC
jgi:hypothetical protein